jgi:catechol 2,3-dioxygenase-like lactoylglutathione lyase family enzyme
MLVVRDLDVSVPFYCDRLGFRLLRRDEGIAALELGPFKLYLFTFSPPTPDKPGITCANLNTADQTPVILDLMVRDCWASYEALRRQGVEFLTRPTAPPWGGLRCFARDPDGYLIELEENPGSPFMEPARE